MNDFEGKMNYCINSPLNFFLTISLCFIGFVSYSQSVGAELQIDSSAIQIGAQVKATFKVTTSRSDKVKFPEITKFINDQIEVIELYQVDTQSVDSLQVLSQSFIITAFDSGVFSIPAFDFLVKKDDGIVDTLRTHPVSLTVGLMPIDTAQDIKDVKQPLDTPFEKNELWSYLNLALIVLIVLILALIAFYFYRLQRSKPKPVIIPVLKKESPGAVALNALEKVKKEGKWRSKEAQKDFHEEVSRILRRYIEDRFKIPAIESTTNEILIEIRKRALEKKMYHSLNQIFTLGDLVKYAKFHPEPSENEASLNNAFLFVHNTGGSQIVEVDNA